MFTLYICKTDVRNESRSCQSLSLFTVPHRVRPSSSLVFWFVLLIYFADLAHWWYLIEQFLSSTRTCTPKPIDSLYSVLIIIRDLDDLLAQPVSPMPCSEALYFEFCINWPQTHLASLSVSDIQDARLGLARPSWPWFALSPTMSALAPMSIVWFWHMLSIIPVPLGNRHPVWDKSR